MADNSNEVEFCSRVIKLKGKNDVCRNNQQKVRSPKVWLDYYNDVVRDDLKDIKANTIFNVKRDVLTKTIYPKNKNSALLLHNPFDFNLKRTHHANEGNGPSGVRSAHSTVCTERKKNFFFEDFVWNNELKRYVQLERVDGGQNKKHGKQSGTPRQGANCGKSTRRSKPCMGLDNRAGVINHQRGNGINLEKYTRLSGAGGLATRQRRNGPVAIRQRPIEEPSANPYGHLKGHPNSHPNERHGADDPSADPSAFLAAYQRGYHSAKPSTYTTSNYNPAVVAYPNAPTPDVAHQIEEKLKNMILAKSQALKNDTMRNNHGENILMVQDQKSGRAKIVANKRIEIGQVIFVEECVLETSILLEHLWDTFNSLDNEQRKKLDKISEYMNLGRENSSGAHTHVGGSISLPVSEELLAKPVSKMIDGNKHTTPHGGEKSPRVISYCQSGENTYEKYTRHISHRISNILKNSFISPKDKTKIMLFQYASLLNHSCFPNASYCYIDVNKICFISMRTITRYEEITISLIDELYSSIHHRRSKLIQVKNDTCFCNRCSQIIDQERHILCPFCKYSYVRKGIDPKYLKNAYHSGHHNGHHNGGRDIFHWGDESEPSSVGVFQGGAMQKGQTHKQVMSTQRDKVSSYSDTSSSEYVPFTQEKVYPQREVNKSPYHYAPGDEGGTGCYSGRPNQMEGGITNKKNMRKTGKNSQEELSMRSVSKNDTERLSMCAQKRMSTERITTWDDTSSMGEVPVGNFNIRRFEEGLNIANILMFIWNTQNERNEIGCCRFHNNEELWICDTCGEAVSSCALPVASEQNFTKVYKLLRDMISSNQLDSEHSVDYILTTIERSLIYIIGILGEKHWLYASFNYLMADLCFSICCYSSDSSKWDRYLLKGFNSFQNFLWFIQTRSPHSIHTDLVPLVLKFFLVCIYTCNYKTLYEFARSGFLELIRQKYGPWNIPFMCLYLSFEMCYAHINRTLPICREILLVLANMTRVRLFEELPPW
ncbi:hypothetical protein AK88_00851 [Plasmodium fragile]|uniref:SET domain-containing protein n=1 Tax=Plasmodium fragile TaxID=5857 RepID=A0A0D9QR38_PLAFR|nr:uncharacterized protein AK88_00851 [Plasmodium fragile]KJP89408.1 hypothetical protein AK88_00851 [Plasmodium fragile]